MKEATLKEPNVHTKTDTSPKNPTAMLAAGRPWILGVVGLSFLVNLLMLTGPVYMLQVYDRVLSSRSLDTLVALSAIMAALFVFMGVFDHLRARVLARAGLLWSDAARVWLEQRSLPLEQARAVARESDVVARAYAHPSALGLLDIIWMPMFLVALAALHPIIAAVTLGGLITSLGMALSAQAFGAAHEKIAMQASTQGQSLEASLLRDAATLESLGATEASRMRWMETRANGETTAVLSADATGAWQTASKTFRLFFQSVLLGVGAYLAVRGDLTPGAMIAGSILGGRALAPFDQLLSGLPLLAKAKTARAVLLRAFGEPERKDVAGAVPERPAAKLESTGAAYAAPGRPAALRDLRFALKPGQCIAIFGASGSGKSAALRLMAGAWTPSAGVILFDGVPLADWPERARARAIGHLGQDAHLPDGTVGAILRGFDDSVGDDDVIAAAKTAGIHDSIVDLPKGYGERIENGGLHMPYGLRRGILRAAALRTGRVLLALDDPGAGADPKQTVELARHLKNHLDAQGAVAMISDHPDLLRVVTHALVLEKGRTIAFGPILEVVDSYVKDVLARNDRSHVPAGLLPAVMRRMPKTAPAIAPTTHEGAPA